MHEGKVFKDPVDGTYKEPFKPRDGHEVYQRSCIDHFAGERAIQVALQEKNSGILVGTAFIFWARFYAVVSLICATICYSIVVVFFPLLNSPSLSWLPSLFVIGGGVSLLFLAYHCLSLSAAMKLKRQDKDQGISAEFLERILHYRKGSLSTSDRAKQQIAEVLSSLQALKRRAGAGHRLSAQSQGKDE
ncbi:unnamed protein product [Vitrella brassicaformis CCMP3155]|uniref:Uncharacterized protein n=1 Tax=Vitrella brassicaformis (strain CCMP3155) TaxID=1169540 RepID=A0A0G4FDQ6_VITBC|nr:unnamed protein product [Vitrella brassicaformis CCMP3155]|eukprot:CEM11314.1 unnamed protein product [Vitrella brassicaformis CCMP3155]